MATAGRERDRYPLLEPGTSYTAINDQMAAVVLGGRTPRGFWIGFMVCAALAMAFLAACTYLFAAGVGIFGINIPVAWGFPIVNVVWWIGIGHAGTLISAVLLLLRQPWRTSINRFAEAMTLFAASIAAFFPLIHLGRPWFFYWILPYYDTMGLWPQWRSPLVWDFFAIGTYLIVSLIFWYLGLMPDLGTLRDRATSRFKQVVYGFLALGWRGSAMHWIRLQRVYLIIAAFATPLVVSVHSVIALDFAATILPGYHSTIFPPYFVAGALFSGFAMVLTITLPLRAGFGLHDFITQRHIDIMARIMLTTGFVVAYGYIMEIFMAWYSGDEFHIYMMANRMLGPYAWAFWTMLACNILVIQPLWWRRVRLNHVALFAIAILVNVGMWLERYVIVITSAHRDFLPSMWETPRPTGWDWMFLIGSIGLFFALMFLFVRLLPAISTFEVRELAYERQHEED